MKNKEEEHIKGKEKYNKTNNNLSSSYIRMLFRTTHLYVMERVGWIWRRYNKLKRYASFIKISFIL